MTSKTPSDEAVGTSSWNRSLIELTKTVLGAAHRFGRSRASGWRVRPKPGPEVRGSPSRWYFGMPMAFSRFDRVRA